MIIPSYFLTSFVFFIAWHGFFPVPAPQSLERIASQRNFAACWAPPVLGGGALPEEGAGVVRLDLVARMTRCNDHWGYVRIDFVKKNYLLLLELELLYNINIIIWLREWVKR